MRKALMFFSIIIINSLPSHSIASPYSTQNTENESWFYAQFSKLEDKFKSAIEDAVDNAFEESMYKLLGEGIADKFGETFSKNLSGIISIGPFLSVTDVLGLGQRNTESQVMLKIILQAIEEAKEEIIASVELQFQDETEARLNTIIRDLDIYNSRSLASRQTSYPVLNDLISHANYVLERIEQKEDKYAENLHRYITLSALQIQMQKEYTHWLLIDSNPSISEEEIELETKEVLATQIGFVTNFLSSSKVGTIDFWKQTFRNEFSNRSDIRFDGRIENSGFPFIDGVSNKKKSGKRPTIYDATDKNNSGYYTYSMGTGRVKFKAIMEQCSGGRSTHFDFYLFDTAGRHAGHALKNYGNRGEMCDRVNQNPLTQLPDTIISSDAMQTVIENHIGDTDAFNDYIMSGYKPIKEIVDKWWELTGRPPRAMSEIDAYISSL